MNKQKTAAPHSHAKQRGDIRHGLAARRGTPGSQECALPSPGPVGIQGPCLEASSSPEVGLDHCAGGAGPLHQPHPQQPVTGWAAQGRLGSRVGKFSTTQGSGNGLLPRPSHSLGSAIVSGQCKKPRAPGWCPLCPPWGQGFLPSQMPLPRHPYPNPQGQ